MNNDYPITLHHFEKSPFSWCIFRVPDSWLYR